MQQLDVDESSQEGPSTKQAGWVDATGTRQHPPEREDLLRERDELQEQVRRLESELERYRAHAERTSKLYLVATDYAEWIRENARRDAELALRKARARAEKTLADLERERVRTDRDILRLQALTDATRTRLASFARAALPALRAELEARQTDGPGLTPDDLHDELRAKLAPTYRSAPAQLTDGEKPQI